MKLKFRAGLLAALSAAAVYTGARACRSLRPAVRDALPAEIYARYSSREESAEYFLKNCDGFVAVYRSTKGRAPESVTAIEIAGRGRQGDARTGHTRVRPAGAFGAAGGFRLIISY